MNDYNECHKECSCFYHDKDKGECTFKTLCVVANLPAEKEVVKDG